MHVRGTIAWQRDEAWLRSFLEALIESQEAQRAAPWRIADAPTSYIERMLASIVGFEIAVTDMTGKWKLGQNRPAGDRAGIAAGLAAEDTRRRGTNDRVARWSPGSARERYRYPLMLLALTRALSPRIVDCQLTHLERQPIDLARAAEEHTAYERQLSELGATVRRLPPAPELPDGVFVEDTAVVLDEVAVIARPGAESRRGETASVAADLAGYRPTIAIESPGTLDGGDVLVVDRQVFVGRSTRTNAAGIEQLRARARAARVPS